MKVTRKSRAFTVKITKALGASYYQIAYKKKGASTWKYISTTSRTKTIKNLAKKTKYEVRVRSMKKVSRTVYSSAWSKSYYVTTR